MRSLKVVASLALLIVPFSGCLGSGDSTDSGEGPSSSSAGTPPGGNDSVGFPPVVEVQVSVNGTTVPVDNASFAVEANTTVVFDAGNSSDPEGGNLTFAWDFGDGTVGDGPAANHSWALPGNYSVVVTATDEENLSSNVSLQVEILVPAPTGPPPPAVYFLDDAEGSIAWTTVKHIMFSLLHGSDSTVITQNHPRSAGWHKATKEKYQGTKSWTFQDESVSMYHDHEYTHMTSPKISLKGATSAELTFLYKGDTESNNFDGMSWLVSTDGTTFTQLGFKSGKVDPWTEVKADLKAYLGKDINLRFLFRSDASCGQETAAMGGTALCGAGAFTGYFVDNIKVAAKA